MTGASVRQRQWLCIRGGTSWRMVRMVVVRPCPRGLLSVGSFGEAAGFFGRNPCRLGRHRRGAASGWHHPFMKGVVATLPLLPRVPGETLGPVRWPGQQHSLSFFKVLLGT